MDIFSSYFLDAIKEGDGDRLLRQYKYFLLYCRADRSGSTKYALECLYQFFQVYALMSPRDSERLVWNRSVNNHGHKVCNIPLDESTEHSNNFLKQGIKDLGPNVSEEAVSRLCKAETSTRLILESTDRSLDRASRHSHVNTEKDLEELIKNVVRLDVFSEREGRKYGHFANFRRNRLENLDTSSLYQWINKHKKNIAIGIKAR